MKLLQELHWIHQMLQNVVHGHSLGKRDLSNRCGMKHIALTHISSCRNRRCDRARRLLNTCYGMTIGLGQQTETPTACSQINNWTSYTLGKIGIGIID